MMTTTQLNIFMEVFGAKKLDNDSRFQSNELVYEIDGELFILTCEVEKNCHLITSYEKYSNSFYDIASETELIVFLINNTHNPLNLTHNDVAVKYSSKLCELTNSKYLELSSDFSENIPEADDDLHSLPLEIKNLVETLLSINLFITNKKDLFTDYQHLQNFCDNTTLNVDITSDKLMIEIDNFFENVNSQIVLTKDSIYCSFNYYLKKQKGSMNISYYFDSEHHELSYVFIEESATTFFNSPTFERIYDIYTNQVLDENCDEIIGDLKELSSISKTVNQKSQTAFQKYLIST